MPASAFARAAAALLLFSGWMGLLFAGFLLHGALHLLLVGAAALFPWRSLPPPLPPEPPLVSLSPLPPLPPKASGDPPRD